METKFTSGPWHVINWGQQSQIRDKNHGEIAMLNREGNFNAGLPDEETSANAKLIAAAPELLEALSDIMEHLPKNNQLVAEGYMLQAYKALAKARR